MVSIPDETVDSDTGVTPTGIKSGILVSMTRQRDRIYALARVRQDVQCGQFYFL